MNETTLVDDNVINYKYHFKFEDGKEILYEINLNSETLELITPKTETYPEWTNLEFQQCPNCPLDKKQNQQCPIAKNTIQIIDIFGQMKSIDKILLRITTEQRIYSKETDLQSGLGSLMGLIMVTSGCPILDKLRPMSRFHLPFASNEETLYRVISMYLLGEFFKLKEGKTPDWDLKDLHLLYKNINVVNNAFFKRLQQTETLDATLNALILLDTFEKFVDLSIDEQSLSDIKLLFKAYLKKEES